MIYIYISGAFGVGLIRIFTHRFHVENWHTQIDHSSCLMVRTFLSFCCWCILFCVLYFCNKNRAAAHRLIRTLKKQQNWTIHYRLIQYQMFPFFSNINHMHWKTKCGLRCLLEIPEKERKSITDLVSFFFCFYSMMIYHLYDVQCAI